ncbi:MAG: phosphotransferase [Sulfuricaulis sp.]|nr:phosphotransferase [Sulfuricaulis sp.]
MNALLTAPNLPLHFDEVTPLWLTQALANSFPGVTVATAERDKDRFGTAASARFKLSYSDRAGHADLPSSVYVKGGFDDTWRKRVWQALHQEVRFYAEIASDITLNIPKCYFYGLNDAPQGVLVLEDLTQRGVRFGLNLAPATADNVAAVLEQVARMHAQWWESPRLAPYTSWGEPQRVYLKWLYRPKHWEELAARKHGELITQALGNSATAIRSLEKLWEIMDAKPKTLLHGDLHGGNIFYEQDGRPGFLDWQLVFAGNYMHDMAWIIVTGLDVAQRRKHEQDLVRHYLAALKAHRGEAPSFDEAWLAYRQNMAHAIASYGAAPHDADKTSVVEGSAERVLHAAVDHDVLASLGLTRS